MNAYTPEDTARIFHSFMDYWRDAPESLAKDNALVMLFAWAADRERLDGVLETLWFEHYKDVYPEARIDHGDCLACRALADLRGEEEG